MTQNQISYMKVVEDRRHNMNVEAETQRANMAQEALKKAQQQVEAQHYLRQDTETQRSNLMRESQNAETISQGYTKLAQEDARIRETARNNRNNEEIAWINANAKASEAASKALESRASAEQAYAHAGLYYAETALTDTEAALNVARTGLTEAQRDVAVVQLPNVIADTQMKRAQRDNVITQTKFIPLNTWANVIGRLSLGGYVK